MYSLVFRFFSLRSILRLLLSLALGVPHGRLLLHHSRIGSWRLDILQLVILFRLSFLSRFVNKPEFVEDFGSCQEDVEDGRGQDGLDDDVLVVPLLVVVVAEGHRFHQPIEAAAPPQNLKRAHRVPDQGDEAEPAALAAISLNKIQAAGKANLKFD